MESNICKVIMGMPLYVYKYADTSKSIRKNHTYTRHPLILLEYTYSDKNIKSLSYYYSDNEEYYELSLNDLLVERYITKIPLLKRFCVNRSRSISDSKEMANDMLNHKIDRMERKKLERRAKNYTKSKRYLRKRLRLILLKEGE